MAIRIFSKIRHTYYRLKHDYFTRQNILVVVFIALFALLSISSVSSMSRNWQQQKQIEERQIVLAKLKAEVTALEQEKIYHQSLEYQDLLAREKQNKKLPGETMLILPKNSESTKNKYAETVAEATPKPSNLQQWIDFFLR